MTERLYFLDSMLFSCDATVISCAPCEKGFLVELDRTVFFPNKGGQPCDTGVIGDAAVSSCDEQNDRLLHLCNHPLEPGTPVKVQIDADRRFDIMQQHTGEHLLSWCAWKLFDATNVGFHCALDYATLDLDKPLSHDQVLQMECLANREAAKNAAVTAKEFETEDALAASGIVLRKHAEGLIAPIRVVSIEGSDSCTCCAPHVKRTGEIGQLKVIGELPYKGGVRLTFLCGMRALLHAQHIQDAIDAIALSFSTGRDNAVSAVEKQTSELSETKKVLRQAYAALDESIAKELAKKAEIIRGVSVLVEALDHVDMKRLRALALKTASKKSFCALFSTIDDTIYYVLSSNGIQHDMGELSKAVNLALGGKGGGRGSLAQGSSVKKNDFNETLDQLRHYFYQII
ncbi:MAG: hypothetical protein IKF49_08350 [Clostridia bacterium]|nr:hypothetical protein [Clostridia bacterium]